MKNFVLRAKKVNRNKLHSLVDYLTRACNLPADSAIANKQSFTYNSTDKQYKAVKKLVKELYERGEVECVL